MRAIIIDDKDAIALVEQLELASWKTEVQTENRTPGQIRDDLYTRFRYIVVGWLHEQGCNVVR